MSAAPVGRWLLIAAAVVVVATLVAAILAMGSPAAQRERALDLRRVQDLQLIENAVDMHYRVNGRLPNDLATLRQPGIALATVDPVTAAPYDYQTVGSRSYRLCAEFTTDTGAEDANDAAPVQRRWAHGIGRRCYDLRSEARRPD